MTCLPYLTRTPMKEPCLSYSPCIPRTQNKTWHIVGTQYTVKSKVLKTFYVELMILILVK